MNYNTLLEDLAYYEGEIERIEALSDEEYAAAVDYEFNLKLPNNQSYNRHEEVKELFGLTGK